MMYGFEFDGALVKTDADQCVLKAMRTHDSESLALHNNNNKSHASK